MVQDLLAMVRRMTVIVVKKRLIRIVIVIVLVVVTVIGVVNWGYIGIMERKMDTIGIIGIICKTLSSRAAAHYKCS